MSQAQIEREIEGLLRRLYIPEMDARALRAAITEMPSGASVRGAYVFLVLSTWEDEQAEAVRVLRDIMGRLSITFFGMVSYPLLTAMAAYLSRRIHLDLPIIMSTNALAEDMLRRHHNHTVLNVLKRVSNHSVAGFLNNFEHLEPLIWNFQASHIEHHSETHATFIVEAPYGRAVAYTAEGFIRGLVECFGEEAEMNAAINADGDFVLDIYY